ncbi:MAG: serine/threonine protein kinase [Pyrinomonadaceae bacterium]|nr:serine/threonine protein kinase [Pyrinomonadaceae bacterium]
MLKIGEEIKDFTLVKFLGRGGFGEVWLAEKKIELADKKVPFALKFLSGQNHGGIDLESVKREVNTWIDASGNKQVVSVLDGFMHDGMFVIVSEFADGGSLRDWLRNNGGKAPSIEKAVELMGGILDGLTHLHSNKIVHRDLKPENILLKGDVPCIADFGVSRVIQTLSFGDSFGTNAAGSPHYMSPESFERIIPSPQVDVWSAGVILYEMLCGKYPYQADTVPALVLEIITKEPKSMPPTVPLEIQEVVKKALSKNAVERFSSAKEMRDALLKAFYLQDQLRTAKDVELKNNSQTVNYLSSQNSLAENETLKADLKAAKPKSSFALVFATAGILLFLFGGIGLAAWAFWGNKPKPEKENTIITNQTPNPEPNKNLPENTAKNQNSEVANSNTDLKTTEKTKTTALQKTTKSNEKQVEQPNKSGKKTGSKEKVTLDKLLEKN